LPSFRLVDLLDILLVAAVIYWVLSFIRGTRAVQILSGLVVILGLFIAAKRIGMVTFQWLMGNVLGYLIVVLVVIFQTEIRRGLAMVGQARFFGRPPAPSSRALLAEIAAAAVRLSEGRIGAILLIERGIGLEEYIRHGCRIDALFSYELLASLLGASSPVHDGAVVLRGDRIAAAGVVLPFFADTAAVPIMGTRHRAASSITAETDAVAVVVSEETGRITVFHDGERQVAGGAGDLVRILEPLFPARGEGSRGGG